MGAVARSSALGATQTVDTAANANAGLRGRFLEYVLAFIAPAIDTGYDKIPASMRMRT